MAELTSALPDPELMAQFCVAVLAVIVAWDAWWLGRQRVDIPNLGDLPNSGFAWESNQSEEVSRQWANLMTMGAMMVLPWMLAELSDTPVLWVWIWDILLAIHLISLLIPKRYAVTSTHLFADGQRYEWNRLKLAKRQPKKRIMLLRKGWGPFGPLPLGGDRTTLSKAIELIDTILNEEEESSVHSFCCFLCTHPCNNTESDLVDDICNIVSNSHDFSAVVHFNQCYFRTE